MLARLISSFRPIHPLQSPTWPALGWYINPHSLAMGRKSARALTSTAQSSSTSPQDQEDRQISTAKLTSDVTIKACLTCGRQITPRAKWVKNWTSIKYCSERCRSSRPGKAKVSLELQGPNGQEAFFIQRIARLQDDREVLVDDNVNIDVEALIEATIIFSAAKYSGVSQKKGATLEDAENLLREIVPATPQTSSKLIDSLWKALDSPPGLRERVRRAARRLALGITHNSSDEQTANVTTEAGSIQLLQHGIPLTTIEQLSFAKGTLYVKLPIKNS